MVTLENGKQIEPKADDPVRCLVHDMTVKWGDLDAIQQLAVEEGIDTTEDLPCLLAPKLKPTA